MIKFRNIVKSEEGRTEPLTIDEAKAWLKVDYSDDDDLITAIITKSRNWVEEYCNISIILKDITATITVDPQDYGSWRGRISRWDLAFFGVSTGAQWITLPYGPVQDIESITTADCNGQNQVLLVADTDYFTDGDQIKLAANADRVLIEYETGYDPRSIPEGLRTAMLCQIAFYYEQRGNTINRYTGQDVGSSEAARNAAQPFISYAL